MLTIVSSLRNAIGVSPDLASCGNSQAFRKDTTVLQLKMSSPTLVYSYASLRIQPVYYGTTL